MPDLTREEKLAIASTITQQINAVDFWARARWGYREPMALDCGLRFRATGAAVKRALVYVHLDQATDSYTVELYRIEKQPIVPGSKIKFDQSVLVSRDDGIQWDTLAPVIDQLLSTQASWTPVIERVAR